MEGIKEYLPLVVPIVIIQIILLVIAIRHILTHETYKRGNRKIWLVVTIVLMNYVGPILYFLFGKEDE